MIFITAILAGVVAALCMHGVMLWITKQAPTSINFVDALGSLLTKRESNNESIGFTLHLIAGGVLALAYVLILKFLQISGFIPTVGVATFIGFIHGILMSYVLLAFVSTKHPLPKYREATLLVASIHWLGHIVYGAVLGIFLGIFGAYL